MEIELLIEKWVQNGLALAHSPVNEDTPHKPLPIFVHGALPGEQVLARILRKNEKHAFALTTEILSPSMNRIASDCNAFPECGGCSYRHMDYSEELQLKRSLLDELQPLGSILEKLQAQVQHDQPDHYRNHSQLKCDSGQKGFFGLYSNNIVALPEYGCKLASPAINQAMIDYVCPESVSKKSRLSFRETAHGVLTPEQIHSKKTITTHIEGPEGLTWKYPADSFFQANRFLLPRWLNAIKEMLPDHIDHLMELYSGSGLIAGYTQDRWNRLTAMDSDSPAIRHLPQNFPGREKDIKTVRLDLQRQTPRMENVDVVVLDPPRAGINRALQEKLGSSRPPLIIYSSCNPHTLNRDIQALTRHHNYSVTEARIFDFFPRTPHLELVVALEANHSINGKDLSGKADKNSVE